MKRVTLSALVLVLVTSSGMVLAERGNSGHRGGQSHGHSYGHGNHGYSRGHHSAHWYPRPYYRTVYYYPSPYRHDYYSHHDYHSDYYEPLGAALIGAAVTYSIFHSHDDGYTSSSSSRDVVGCHRIERYPNGSERRIEVPLAECY